MNLDEMEKRLDALEKRIVHAEDVIAVTKEIVKVAHTCGVSVEAEIGHVAAPEGSVEGSVADASKFTRPEDAARFVEQTGVDALAIAFGTVHGVYKGTPHLDLERLAEIKGISFEECARITLENGKRFYGIS